MQDGIIFANEGRVGNRRVGVQLDYSNPICITDSDLSIIAQSSREAQFEIRTNHPMTENVYFDDLTIREYGAEDRLVGAVRLYRESGCLSLLRVSIDDFSSLSSIAKQKLIYTYSIARAVRGNILDANIQDIILSYLSPLHMDDRLRYELGSLYDQESYSAFDEAPIRDRGSIRGVLSGVLNNNMKRKLKYSYVKRGKRFIMKEVKSKRDIVSIIVSYLWQSWGRPPHNIQEFRQVFTEDEDPDGNLHELHIGHDSLSRIRIGEGLHQSFTFSESLALSANEIFKGDYYRMILQGAHGTRDNLWIPPLDDTIAEVFDPSDQTLAEFIEGGEIYRGSYVLIVNEIDGIHNRWTAFSNGGFIEHSIAYRLKTYGLPGIAIQMVKTENGRYDYYHLGVMWGEILTEQLGTARASLCYVGNINDRSPSIFSSRFNVMVDMFSESSQSSDYWLATAQITSGRCIRYPCQLDSRVDMAVDKYLERNNALGHVRRISLYCFMRLCSTSSLFIFATSGPCYIKVVGKLPAQRGSNESTLNLETFHIFVDSKNQAVIRHAGLIRCTCQDLALSLGWDDWHQKACVFSIPKVPKGREDRVFGVGDNVYLPT